MVAVALTVPLSKAALVAGQRRLPQNLMQVKLHPREANIHTCNRDVQQIKWIASVKVGELSEC